MKASFILNLILLFHIGHGVEKAHSSKVRRELADDVPDVAKVLESFPSLVLVSDPLNGTMFECCQVCQTDFRKEQKSATYSWILPKLGQILQLDAQAEEDNPGAYIFTAGDDSIVMSGRYHYTDYTSCLILDFNFHGYQCMLLVPPEFKDDVPLPCVDHFLKSCGSSAKVLNDDHCKFVECDEE